MRSDGKPLDFIGAALLGAGIARPLQQVESDALPGNPPKRENRQQRRARERKEGSNDV